MNLSKGHLQLTAMLLLLCCIGNHIYSQYDKLGIEFSSTMQHDSSSKFLQIPPDPQDDNFALAGKIPAIDFAIQQGLDSWNANSAEYQWLDCDINHNQIANENDQSFTANKSGNYAVEVTQNNCLDTSDCYS